MGAVERVLVLGIVVVIVAILGIAVWGAAGDDSGKVVAATDGGAVVTGLEAPAAPVTAESESTGSPVTGIEAWRELHERERAARTPDAGAAPLANSAAPGGAAATPVAPAPGAPTDAPALKTATQLETNVTVQPPLPQPAAPVAAAPAPAADAATAAKARAKEAAQAAGAYTVVAGDSLWKIAHKSYGDADIQAHIDAILAANPKVDPDNLKIGQKLTLPGKVATDINRLPAKQQVAHTEGSLYEVATGDTLSSIARKKLGDSSRWKEIYELNRERISDPANIFVGTTLRLPKN